MLTTTRKQLIERVIERDGMLYRVVFAVSSDFGQMRAEILRVTPLGNLEDHAEIIALPQAQKETEYAEVLETIFYSSVVSPYTNLIFVNGSKPRAPTL